MPRPGVVGLVVLLLVASVAPAAVAVADPGGPGAGLAQSASQEFESTEFHITVYRNASARWAFVFKTPLTNDTERQDFREYADRFDSRETQLYTDFRDRARGLTARGANVTGRPMDATGFSREARINAVGNQGIVRMSFRWSAFAARDGDAVVVGDVFDGGFYVGPDQRLVVERGPELRFRSATPQPITSDDTVAASDSLTWRGERSFVDERPRVRLAPPADPTPTTTPTPTPTDAPGAAGPGDGDGDAGFLPLLGLGVIVLIGLGAVLAYQAGALPGVGEDDDGDDATGGDAGGGGTAGGAGAAAGEADTDEPAVPDEELLADDDRVLRLLDEHGGRMKQVNIVEETGWSKSKVSMLLSDMEEADQISKLRVGRENIISVKGMEPDAAGSPFDDEE
jgi:hypothetical protein